MDTKIKPGELAPNFSFPSNKGTITLTDYLGKKSVVLFFYPKDETPGCTKESCSFRDSYESFIKADSEVVGVSSDSLKSHESFAKNHRLPFPLVSDEKGELRKLYQVPKTLGFLPGRVTYVIDKLGIIRHIFSSQLQATKHIEEALNTIQNM